MKKTKMLFNLIISKIKNLFKKKPKKTNITRLCEYVEEIKKTNTSFKAIYKDDFIQIELSNVKNKKESQ